MAADTTHPPATRSPAPGHGWYRLVGAAALLLASSCASVSYYGQAVWGGLEVLAKRRAIPRLLADPATPEPLAAKLRQVLALRDFATAALGLPDNGSYRSYADLGRPWAVWNVVAAPELSVEPKIWCFPVAGCVSYRGFFSQRAAERFAARLAERSFDVSVGPVTAYSTLGFFDDPVLNTFVELPEPQLAGLIFHELAHQLVYVKDDTVFNESFATAVEIEGVTRWLTAQGRAAELESYLADRDREEQVMDLMVAARQRLAALFAENRPDDWKRRQKAAVLAELVADYRHLRTAWGGDGRFDDWFEPPLDNADLAALGPYHELVGAFQALLAARGGELAAFYDEVRRLVPLAPEARRAELGRVAPQG